MSVQKLAHLRRRQRDAGLTAWERAQELFDKDKDDWQHTLDDDHDLIYQHALDRPCAIYKDPAHYVHGKANRSQATNTKQYKKRLVSKCTRPDRYHH